MIHSPASAGLFHFRREHERHQDTAVYESAGQILQPPTAAVPSAEGRSHSSGSPPEKEPTPRIHSRITTGRPTPEFGPTPRNLWELAQEINPPLYASVCLYTRSSCGQVGLPTLCRDRAFYAHTGSYALDKRRMGQSFTHNGVTWKLLPCSG